MSIEPQVRWSVDPNETVALRFDDDTFLEALRSATGDLAESLERLLGGPPADASFHALIADGVVILARAGIIGREDDQLGTRSQQHDARKGIKVDVHEGNKAQWGAWVVGVEAEVGEVPAKLSSPRRKDREEAFSLLPVPIKNAFTARLAVHVREANAGALRDPNKAGPDPVTGKARLPTSGNAGGSSATALPASA